MDEPFTGVDAATQEATLELLDDLQAQQVTVMISTHDLNLAAARFEQVLLLNHRVVAYGRWMKCSRRRRWGRRLAVRC